MEDNHTINISLIKTALHVSLKCIEDTTLIDQRVQNTINAAILELDKFNSSYFQVKNPPLYLTSIGLRNMYGEFNPDYNGEFIEKKD